MAWDTEGTKRKIKDASDDSDLHESSFQWVRCCSEVSVPGAGNLAMTRWYDLDTEYLKVTKGVCCVTD